MDLPSSSAGSLDVAAVGARVVQSAGPQTTEAVGEQLAAELDGGQVVFIAGGLGAGKTTLVRGIARGLGVTGAVTSPTFTLAQRYRGGRADLAHLDLYRLGEGVGEEPGLLDDYLDSRTVVAVEWPDLPAAAILGVVPDLVVRVEDRGGERRQLVVERRR